MPKNNLDRLFSFASWVIVIALIVAVAGLFIFPPSGTGPVAQLIGIKGAQIFYVILYGGEAILLAYAKVFNKNRMRKNVLLAIYFTGIFTSLLTIMGVGVVASLWDNVTFSVASGACWLYWKFRTEYITKEEIMQGNINLPCKDKTK